jgi:hypothetical protein
MLYGTLAGTGIDDLNDEGLWVEGPGGLERLAREGEQAPGLPAGIKFGSSSGIDVFESPAPTVLGDTGAGSVK